MPARHRVYWPLAPPHQSDSSLNHLKCWPGCLTFSKKLSLQRFCDRFSYSIWFCSPSLKTQLQSHHYGFIRVQLHFLRINFSFLSFLKYVISMAATKETCAHLFAGSLIPQTQRLKHIHYGTQYCTAYNGNAFHLAVLRSIVNIINHTE